MGFFDKLKKITSNLFSGFTEADEAFFEELEETLIMADLGVDAATDAVEKLRTKVRKEHLQGQEEVREALREILMAEMEVGDTSLKLDTKPSVCIFIGVNGVGKTTSIGKVAASLRKQGKRVLLCAADTFRAAAADQLEIWAERAGCEIVRQYEGADPGAVLFDALQAAKARNVDVVLTIAAAVESVSQHPLAAAIVQAAQNRGLDLSGKPDEFENLSGRGIRAVRSGVTVLAGNRRLMEENGVDISALTEKADTLAAQGETPMYFAAGGKVLGLISVADPVKETSADAIAALHRQGIRVVMLTGDSKAAAEHIGSVVGVDEVIPEVLPEEKALHVQKLEAEGRRVMMVGDGINDAPALTAATVGCAIGSGSDIAIESADIVLMRSDLEDVPRALRLSALTLRDIKQNLFWAFCYNTVGIPIAAGLLYAFGGPLLSPMFAGAAMSLSSVCVVGNALRLGTVKL